MKKFTDGRTDRRTDGRTDAEGNNIIRPFFERAYKNPHAHLQYVHNMSAKFEKHQVKVCEELTPQIPYPTMQKMSKIRKFKGTNSVKINSSSTKAHMHIFIMSTSMLQKDPFKAAGEVGYTSSIPYKQKNCLK